MEETLKFLLVCGTEDRAVSLSESDTVGRIKLEAEYAFSIPLNRLSITGWFSVPQSDNVPLKECYNPKHEINLLTVKAAIPAPNDNNGKTFQDPDDNGRGFTATRVNCESGAARYADQISIDEHMQVQCAKKLAETVLPSLVTIQCCTLDLALRSISLEKKILLLYLHHSSDVFAQNFNDALKNPLLGEIIDKESFFFLGWDLDDPACHGSIIRSLDRNENLSVISKSVSQKMSSAFCILSFDDTIVTISCMRGEMSPRDIATTLKQTQTILSDKIKQEQELRKLESETASEKDYGVLEFQDHMEEMLGDRDYDRFDKGDHQALMEKIEYALAGPPQKESGYDAQVKENSKALFDVIIRESDPISEYVGRVEIAFIFNCTQPLPKERSKRAVKYDDYNPKTDITPVPIFVLRKCHDSARSCRIFIDDCGRVYQSWTKYLKRNQLPECEMNVPLNGRYQRSNNGKVLLEKHLSPACDIDAKILQATDTTSTVAGLVSGGVMVAGAVPAITLAPFVLIGGAVVGAVAGAYAIGRSSYSLHDRRIHKQSMSFANAEARGAYLNIVAGSLGFVGAGANAAVSQLAARGVNIGRGARAVVTTVGALNIGASGAGLVNIGYDVIEQWIVKNRTPSPLALLQLSSSVLFFGNAVVNFKTAATIIDESQARVLDNYADSLRSNRHRKMLTKLTKETIRQQGGDQARGRANVIKTIRNIPNKDELFASLTRNNKALNREGIKFSADQGQLKLNGVAVNMDQFASLTKTQTEIFFDNLMQQQPQPAEPVVGPSEGFGLSLDWSTSDPAKTLSYLTAAGTFLPSISGSTKQKIVQAVHSVLLELSRPVINRLNLLTGGPWQAARKLTRVVVKYFSGKVDKWEKKYQEWKKSKDPELYEPLWDYIRPDYAKRLTKLLDIAAEMAVSGERVVSWAMKEMLEYVTTWITAKWYEEQNAVRAVPRRSSTRCPDCGGEYFGTPWWN